MSTSTPKTEPNKAEIEALTQGHQFFPYSYDHVDLRDEVSRLLETTEKIHRIHKSRFEERKDGQDDDEIDTALRREHWVAVSLYEDVEIDVMRALKRMRELKQVLLRMPENPRAVRFCEADAVEDEDEEWTLVAEKQNNHVRWSDTDGISPRAQQEKPVRRRLLQCMAFGLLLVLVRAW